MTRFSSSNAANQPVPCADHETINAVHPVHYLGKREAEAEADPAYFAVTRPVAYAHHGYAGYPYAHHAAYATGLVHTSHFGVCTNYLGARVSC